MENAVGYLLLAVFLFLALGYQLTHGLRRVGVWLRLGLRRYKRGKLQRSLPALSLLFLVTLGLSVASLSIWGLAGDKGVALGSAGDFFGGILNPLIAAAALFALLHTIRIQQAELRLTREELQKSSNALEGQVQLYERQLFSQVFAEALGDLDSARREFKFVEALKDDKTTYYGQDAFSSLHDSFYGRMLPYRLKYHKYESEFDLYKAVCDITRNLINLESSPERFARTLAHVCTLASKSPDSVADSFERIALRLSNDELFSAFLLCFTPVGECLLAHIENLHIPALLGNQMCIPRELGDPIDLLRQAHSFSASNPNADASNS
jgi:hypothetical protein